MTRGWWCRRSWRATHVVIIPIIGKARTRSGRRCWRRPQALAADLRKAGLSVVVDDDETKGPGFKYYEYELVGTCLRMELGPEGPGQGLVRDGAPAT